nr:MAG TPA: hypothetical protein [Caudoviricetes sp.]
MSYKEITCKMISEIQNERMLKRIYRFVAYIYVRI